MFMSVVEGLKRLYKSKILPLEEHYLFHEFHSPKLEDADFDAKPMILLVGQYSTGKTTFIKYLLEKVSCQNNSHSVRVKTPYVMGDYQRRNHLVCIVHYCR